MKRPVLPKKNKLTLYPIHDIANAWDDEPFDLTLLPFQLSDSLSIRDVSDLLTGETFALAEMTLGRDDVEKMRDIRYAIVHEYDADLSRLVRSDPRETPDQHSEYLTRMAAACLTIIRPMRQRAMLVQGEINEGGRLSFTHFEHPIELETPMLHRLFSLRLSDAEELREILPTFMEAYDRDTMKFKMAVEFYWTGHYNYHFWKPRFLLWVSALEAIYTSQLRDHKGKRVAIERIKFFLGDKTPIYTNRDLPVSSELPTYTVADMVEPIYNMRNYIAHGESIPDEYFSKFGRTHLGGASVQSIDVLFESVNFLVRATLIKILRQRLLAEFKDGIASAAYFSKFGLVGSKLSKKKSVRP